MLLVITANPTKTTILQGSGCTLILIFTILTGIPSGVTGDFLGTSDGDGEAGTAHGTVHGTAHTGAVDGMPDGDIPGMVTDGDGEDITPTILIILIMEEAIMEVTIVRMAIITAGGITAALVQEMPLPVITEDPPYHQVLGEGASPHHQLGLQPAHRQPLYQEDREQQPQVLYPPVRQDHVTPLILTQSEVQGSALQDSREQEAMLL